MEELKFPKDFLWGVANSAYQVEGYNNNSDWHQWEMKGKTQDKNGKSCDYWNRYTEDHAIAQEINCNAFRTGFEWSKIEPKEGNFDMQAIAHYRNVLRDLKKREMKRVITLWHWTLPVWFSEKGGWHSKDAVKCFTRFCEKVIQELGSEIDLFIVMNEPRLPLNRGYLVGDFPPGRNNPFLYLKARKNMVRACRECYDIVKKSRPNLPTGITQFTNDFDFYGPIKWMSWLTEKVESFYNWYFFDQIGNKQDFIGINYYFALEIGIGWKLIKMQNDNKDLTSMGWGVFPDGLREILEDSWKKYEKPLYIFENGIATEQDNIRAEFIKSHLRATKQAIKNGADVRGYFYWSLTDNFEWNEGFDMRLGLVKIDYKTMERKVRPSAYEYAKICKNNGFQYDLPGE